MNIQKVSKPVYEAVQLYKNGEYYTCLQLLSKIETKNISVMENLLKKFYTDITEWKVFSDLQQNEKTTTEEFPIFSDKDIPTLSKNYNYFEYLIHDEIYYNLSIINKILLGSNEGLLYSDKFKLKGTYIYNKSRLLFAAMCYELNFNDIMMNYIDQIDGVEFPKIKEKANNLRDWSIFSIIDKSFIKTLPNYFYELYESSVWIKQ